MDCAEPSPPCPDARNFDLAPSFPCLAQDLPRPCIPARAYTLCDASAPVCRVSARDTELRWEALGLETCGRVIDLRACD